MNINGVILFSDVTLRGINNLIRELSNIIKTNSNENRLERDSIISIIQWESFANSLGYTISDFDNLYMLGEGKELAQDLLNRLTYEIKEEDVL